MKTVLTKKDVLVAFITVVVALMILAVMCSAAQRQVKMMVCRSNLQKLGVAVSVYMNDYDDKFCWPYWWLHIDPPSKAADDGTPLFCMWHNEDIEPDGQLWPYLDSGDVLLCPFFDSLARGGMAEMHTDCTVAMEPQFGYSMNAYLGGGMSAIGYNYPGEVERLTDITRPPSEVLLFAEENLWVIQGVSLCTFNDSVLIVTWSPSDSLPFCDCIGSFHQTSPGDLNGGRANVVFVDGHVEAAEPEESFVLSWPHEY